MAEENVPWLKRSPAALKSPWNEVQEESNYNEEGWSITPLYYMMGGRGNVLTSSRIEI